jgi:PEGA domain-containing protein
MPALPPLPMRPPPVPPPPSQAASLPTLLPGTAPPGTMPPSMMAPSHAANMPTLGLQTQPQAQPHEPYGAPFPVGTPGQPSYTHDASGLPLGIPTPPGVELNPAAQYAMPHPGYDPRATPQPGYPLSPNALYQFHPSAPQQPLSLTGQMRLFEIDEIPAHYKIMAARRRLFTYILSGILAVSVAAGVTFLIIRATRDTPPNSGTLHLASVPSGADVMFDGTLLSERTPLTIDRVPVGTRHRITIALPHYKQETQDIDIPKTGLEQSIMVQLTVLKGTILVNTVPAGAEIRINGQVRGVTPTKISEVDIDATRSIELRHRDFPPHEVTLKWQPDGVAAVDYRFSH